MSDTIKYISKVEIKGLWGRYDIVWNLNEDVNILSGINGSGKSTILYCISVVLCNNFRSREELDQLGSILKEYTITFNNGEFIDVKFGKNYQIFQNAQENINDEIRRNEIYESFASYGNDNLVTKHGQVYFMTTASTIKLSLFHDQFPVSIINTFDTYLKQFDTPPNLSGDKVKTNLDWEIYDLQRKYLGYQLNILNKKIENIKNTNNAEWDNYKTTVGKYKSKFINIIDSLFLETGKKINKSENEITFLMGEEKISSYQLSSGEKQLLIILLTVLVQDNKNAILFLDEPEVSLHFDWQKKLIGYIRELNPNVQIILATHSPALIMEGWMDKVANVKDLIVADHKPAKNVGKQP